MVSVVGEVPTFPYAVIHYLTEFLAGCCLHAIRSKRSVVDCAGPERKLLWGAQLSSCCAIAASMLGSEKPRSGP